MLKRLLLKYDNYCQGSYELSLMVSTLAHDEVVMSSNLIVGGVFTTIVHPTMMGANDLVAIWKLENFLVEVTCQFFIGSTFQQRYLVWNSPSKSIRLHSTNALLMPIF